AAARVEAQIDAPVGDLAAALAVAIPNACQASKIGAAGKEASCVLRLRARQASGRDVDPAKLQRCRDTLTSAFAGAETRGGGATTSDADTVDRRVDAFAGAGVNAEPLLAACATAGCPAPVLCDPTAGPCWVPPLQSRWQYQLEAAQTEAGDCAFPGTGGIDTGIAAAPFVGGGMVSPEVFDIDALVDPICAPGGSNDVDNAAAVAPLHTARRRAVCYPHARPGPPTRTPSTPAPPAAAACWAGPSPASPRSGGSTSATGTASARSSSDASPRGWSAAGRRGSTRSSSTTSRAMRTGRACRSRRAR